AAAGGVLAAVSFGWFTFRNGPSAHPTPVAAIEQATGRLEVSIGKGYWRQALVGEGVAKGLLLRTAKDSNAMLRLAGGATVRIDGESRLQFIAIDVVRLEQGSLDVDAGGAQPGTPPLEVRTPFGSIHDAGPRFEVRCFDSAVPPLRVRVREGSLIFDGAGRSYRVAAGEALSMRHDGAVMRTQGEGTGGLKP
ncbi:MAG TPA: FecR family protein, partial [Thermoanaerobaculia bacterium]|nr:FecR family protein [Thermoanaerobaculia bacterium]